MFGLEKLETTEDQLLGGRLVVRQYKRAYRVAIDPVLLASSVDAQPGQHVLDMGCGIGGASLCLAARVGNLHICAIEKERQFVELALENVRLNRLERHIKIVCGDLTDPFPFQDKFDWVMANPPYQVQGKSSPSPHPLKAAANMEGKFSLVEWIRVACSAVKKDGHVVFIHRWDRFSELMEGFSMHGRIVALPLAAKAGQSPHRVLVSMRKGGDREKQILPALILHEENGRYRPQLENILRHAARLELT